MWFMEIALNVVCGVRTLGSCEGAVAFPISLGKKL